MNRGHGLGVRGHGIAVLVAVVTALPVAAQGSLLRNSEAEPGFLAWPSQIRKLDRLESLSRRLPAQGPKAPADSWHDFVFLAEARPLLVRVHVRVDGKTLEETNAEFMMHLFRHLDFKGQGYLTNAEMERAPLASQIGSGTFGSIFGGIGGYGGPAAQQSFAEYAAKHVKDGKATWGDLAAYYHAVGLAPFQIEAEADANKGGMMMMLGGGGPTEPTVDDISKAIFALLDTKKTGKLSKAELSAAPTFFCAWMPTRTR